VYSGSDSGVLYALNATTGAQIWSNTIASTACGGVRSSPAVLNNIVYITPCNSSVLALYANNGSILWSRAVTGTFDASSPAVAGNIVYVGSWSGTLYALNATTGTQVWNYTTGNSIYSSPAIAGGMVFLGGYTKALYALNATTGSNI
jgi:outer membrane protein assembly factor BamB